jgi:hypothetical protein
VNWDNSPDKLGRIESNLYNNWGQFCLEISQNSSGRRFAKVLNECSPYVDCLGQVFGPAKRDCNGVCQGTAVHGDANGDGLRNQADLNLYLQGIPDGSISTSTCRDLNGDNVVNAADLAMMMHCLDAQDSTAAVEACDFGPLFNNTESLVKIGVDSVNVQEGYADLSIQNLQDEISAFQFQIEGVVPDSVRFIGLGDSGLVHLRSHASGTIMAAMEGNRLPRHNQPTRFLRVYFDSISGAQLCIASIQVAMSPSQQLLAKLSGPCKPIPQITRLKSKNGKLACRVIPNPFRSETKLHFPDAGSEAYQLLIYDTQGKQVFREDAIRGNQFRLESGKLKPGLYRFVLRGKEQFSGTLLNQP